MCRDAFIGTPAGRDVLNEENVSNCSSLSRDQGPLSSIVKDYTVYTSIDGIHARNGPG